VLSGVDRHVAIRGGGFGGAKVTVSHPTQLEDRSMKSTMHFARRSAAAPVAEFLEDRRLFNAVTSLTLINAQTDQVIKTLNNGDSINLAEFPANQLSIRAEVDQGVQSVRFGMDNVASVRVENAAPYVLFGDVNGNISGGTFSVGEHKFSATPFSADNATGTIGTPVFISFTVTNQPAVTNLVLMNAQTDQAIKTLNSGDTINLSDYPPNQLSIRADVVGGPKSVRFALDDNPNVRTESAAPYVIFGDNPGGDIVGGTFSVGQHEVTATPFTGTNGSGVTGINKSVLINVVNNAPTAPELTGLFLISADTDQVIAEIKGGEVFNRRDLPTEHLNIQATTSGPTGSVRFDLDTTQNPHIENFAPYSLFGDSGAGDFAAGSISDGLHSLSVTPFTGANGTGIGQVHDFFFTINNDPVVTGLFLINTDTQQVIQELHDGDKLSNLPTQHLNIEARTAGRTGSVVFGLDGNGNFRTESVAPYALFGDTNGKFAAGFFSSGQHTISATPFDAANGTGESTDPLVVNFEITNEPVLPDVTGLFLINADNDQVIREIHDGDSINQSDLPTQNLNVNATVNGVTESVKFGLDGNDSFRVESTAPYALFGDASGNFVAGTFNAGPHTITATPFSGDNLTGNSGDPLAVDFTIVAAAQG
jgi:hypothetical protein